jgi:hypothetical protein
VTNPSKFSFLFFGSYTVLERQTQLEEEDNIINKWAQEDVNRLYSLLNDKM